MNLRTLLPLTLLVLAGCPANDDTGLEPATGPERDCDVTFTHVAPEGVLAVEIAGRFNAWTPQPMTASDEAGVHTRWLGALAAGTYGYKVIYDGTWQEPRPEVPTTWEGGVENQALVVGDCRKPALRTVAGEATATGALTATFQFDRAEDGAPLDPAAVDITVGGLPASAVGANIAIDPDTGRITLSATGLPDGKHTVRVTARDTAGLAPEHGDAFLPLWVEPTPYTWQSGVLYYIFLDRFADGGGADTLIDGTEFDGTNFLGGDLVGAREALEDGWFDALGVTSLWLSPVYDNPEQAYPGSGGWHYTGYHGYWPIDPRGVEARLGTDTISGEAALRDLVDAAHARGIRVMLDLVLNHVHEDHPYVATFGLDGEPCVCTDQPGACNWNTNPLGCWFTDYLPDLDYRDQRVVDQMVADVQWWAETFDVDGFRVDAAKHMDHVILRTLSHRLRERYTAPGGAPFYLVGETFVGRGEQGAIMEYVADHELDGQFDFPLLYPIRDAIGRDQGFGGLASEVRAGDAAYGRFVHGMSPFMGNHDIERYATYIAGCDDWMLFGGCQDVLGTPGGPTEEQQGLIDRLALSWAFVVTQPGVPLLYYGDEIGLAGAGDPDNRRMMPWTFTASQQTLLERVQALAQVRRDVPALQTGDRRELWVDDTLYAYGRYGPGLDGAIVVLNRGAQRSQTMAAPAALGLAGRTLTDALGSGSSATVANGEVTVTIGPMQALVLVP